MDTVTATMVEDIRFDCLLAIAKRELAQSARTALLMARLKIMHIEYFPAHGRYKEAASEAAGNS